MRASVVGKTLAVVLILQRGNDPRRFRLLAFCLVLRLLPSSDTGDKGEPRAVRRPAGCRIAFGASGETARFTACRVPHPDVGQILVLVFGKHGDDKGHPSPVGRELRVTDKPDTRDILRRHGAPTGYGHSTPPSEHGDVAIGRNAAIVPVVSPACSRGCSRPSSLMCDAPHPSMLTRQCQTCSTC